jgi:hypothetical protein
MMMKKRKCLVLALLLAAFYPTECRASECRALNNAALRYCSKYGIDADVQTSRYLMSNRVLLNEYYYQLKGSGLSAKDYIIAKQENPQATVPEILQNYEVGKVFAHLGLIPDPHQKTAGHILFKKDRKNFTSEDLAATVYLQTDDAGRGRLGGYLPTPELDQIDAAKYLLALPFVSFTQEDLEAAVHLRTNPGNVWDEPILNPMREEIRAAKTLRARAPTFTKAELLHEWQNQVTQEIMPQLQRLAIDSKKRAVLYFDEENAQLTDAEAAQLIQAVPQLLHAALRANYDQLKRDFVITDAHWEATLVEVRRIAAEVFG